MRPDKDETNPFIKKSYEWKVKSWRWFKGELSLLPAIDNLIINGDCIDGTGSRSGGVELITTDRGEQCEIFIPIVHAIKPKNVSIIRGTEYHVGDTEDWELQIAKRVGADIGDHTWLEYAGKVIDVKHHLGSSQVPHGRYTALARDQLWNVLWAERELQPRAHLIVRSHVHYHVHCGTPYWEALTTPAMEGWTRFGARRMSGTIDYGFIYGEISEEGRLWWEGHFMDMRFARARTRPL